MIRRRPGLGEGGLSLVEAVLALAIFAVVIAFLIPVFSQFLEVNTRSAQRSLAVDAAERVVDDLRRLRINPGGGMPGVPSSGLYKDPPERVTVDGVEFIARVEICPDSSPFCDDDTRLFRVTIVEPDTGREVFELETVYTDLLRR